MIYEPLEDSFLLEGQARKHAKGKVLDMGTGSGIQAVAAAETKGVKEVLAVDIQADVVEYCKKNIKNKKISFQQSNLFSKIKKQKFDTILFNPPYLPEDPRLKDITLDGGKKGFEVVERFLKKAGAYLSDDGIILLLISSLTNQNKVEEILTEHLFDFEILAKKHIFFEDLMVYRIQKSAIAEKLKKKGMQNINYFTHGHRGILYTARYKGKKVTIKAKLPKSRAEGRIANEAKWIKNLSRAGIGPKLVVSENDYFAYEFIDGIFFPKFAEHAKTADVKKVIMDVMRQCWLLDYLGIDKEEMHRPFKHILVRKNNAVLIDFERAHISKKPKNVTQFMQYLASSKLTHVLRKKKIGLSIAEAKKLGTAYKSGKISFDEILKKI